MAHYNGHGQPGSGNHASANGAVTFSRVSDAKDDGGGGTASLGVHHASAMASSPSWSEHDGANDYYKNRKVSDSLAPEDTSYLVHHNHRNYPSYEQVTTTNSTNSNLNTDQAYPSQANLVYQSQSAVDLHNTNNSYPPPPASAAAGNNGYNNNKVPFQPQNPRGHSSKMFGLNLGMSNRMPAALYTVMCGYFTAIGGMCIGFDLVVMQGVLVMPDFLRVIENPSDDTKTFLVTSLFLGALIGTIPACLLADAFGRRLPLMLGALLFAAGSGMQIAADSKGIVMGGRFICGVGAGFMALIGPIYQAEIAPPSMRGMLTTFQHFFVMKGLLVAAFVVYTSTKDHFGEDKQWKMPLGVALGPAIALATMMLFLPESPRWLMKKGRETEALASLARLHSKNDLTDTFVNAEAADIRAAVTADRGSRYPLFAIFRDATNRRRFMIGSIVQASAQVTGQSVVQFYSHPVYVNLGFTVKKTLGFQCAHAGLGVVGSIICFMLVDRVGRRPLAIASMIGCAGAIAGCAGVMDAFPIDSLKEGAKDGHYAYLYLTWVFAFFYSIGIGPISWSYPVEIFNTHTRAWGACLCALTTWLANFVILQGATKGFEKMGWKYFLIFAFMAALNGLILFLNLAETKGRTLEEMDEYWALLPKFFVGFPRRRGELVGRMERENEMRRGHVRRLDEGLQLQDKQPSPA